MFGGNPKVPKPPEPTRDEREQALVNETCGRCLKPIHSQGHKVTWRRRYPEYDSPYNSFEGFVCENPKQ